MILNTPDSRLVLIHPKNKNNLLEILFIGHNKENFRRFKTLSFGSPSLLAAYVPGLNLFTKLARFPPPNQALVLLAVPRESIAFRLFAEFRSRFPDYPGSQCKLADQQDTKSCGIVLVIVIYVEKVKYFEFYKTKIGKSISSFRIIIF